MRFDRKSRKLKSPKQPGGKRSNTFWLFLAAGMAVFALFLYMAYGGHGSRIDKIHEAKIQEDMDRICVAAILFYQDNGRYPSTVEGIEALRADRNSSSPARPVTSTIGYLKRIPHDPWGNPYIYRGPDENLPPLLISLGEDGKTGGDGEFADVTREGCRSTGLAPQ